MERRKVFIIGDSLFAEILTRMIARVGTVELIGTEPTAEAAFSLFRSYSPDVVIVASAGETSLSALCQMLVTFPDLPLIRADLLEDKVQVITSQQIDAHMDDLIAVILALPRRVFT